MIQNNRSDIFFIVLGLYLLKWKPDLWLFMKVYITLEDIDEYVNFGEV